MEDDRSNSLLQTYKLAELKEIWTLKNRIPVVERTEAEMVALIIHESAMEAFLALIRYNEIKIKR